MKRFTGLSFVTLAALAITACTESADIESAPVITDPHGREAAVVDISELDLDMRAIATDLVDEVSTTPPPSGGFSEKGCRWLELEFLGCAVSVGACFIPSSLEPGWSVAVLVTEPYCQP